MNGIFGAGRAEKHARFLSRFFRRPVSRPLVLETAPGLRIEKGDVSRLAAYDRIALVAGYSQTERQSRSTFAYLNELAKSGFGVLYISTCESAKPLEFARPLPDCVLIARRPNVGYDFGSWAVALHTYPDLARKPYVLLTNDSMLGPFAPLSDLLENACRTLRADVLAATMSKQIVTHLQSFFLLFRGGILADPQLGMFFARVRREAAKEDVVKHYELELMRILNYLGYSFSVLYPPGMLGCGSSNPTLASWKRLLDEGWPFVKKTILREPQCAADGKDVARTVARKFHTDINEWV